MNSHHMAEINKNMKYLITIILSVFIFSCTKQKTTIEYFPNGSVKSEYFIVNGKKEGKCIEYYSSGGKCFEKYYKNGLLNGKLIEYYKNGNIKTKGQFTEGKGYGFFRYYNSQNQCDSLHEYILLNPDSIIESVFFDSGKSNKYKESYLNRHIVYNKNRKPILEKSLYFIIKFTKNNLIIGDSLQVELMFCNPSNNKKNKFEVNVAYKDSFIRIVPATGNYRIHYKTKTEKKGINYFQGFIEENTGNNKINYLFFKEKYFVR